ncbi:MAG: InlB B-repeat-containing protein, partial [Eubacteriales bacterium]
TIKAVAKGDSGKFATKPVEIYSKVTIKQGTGSEDLYKKTGETIHLTAIAAPSGYHFKDWTKTGEGTFANSTATETDFTVPASNVTIQSTYELHAATEETWQKDGTRHWHLCSCGAEVDVAPHTPDRSEATETEPVKCTVCGSIITPALGHITHTAGEEWLKNADEHWHQCTGCTEKLGVASHTYGEWTVVTPPTATVDGEQERICSVCGYKQVGSIPATGEPAQVPVTVTGGNGTGNYTEGETVTITANAPEEGKTFKGWRDASGNIVSSDATYTFTVTGEVSLTAVYEDINAGGEQSGGEQSGGEQPVGEQPEKTGLSGGAIACIVIAGVVVAGVGGFSVFWFVIKKKKFADLVALFKKK